MILVISEHGATIGKEGERFYISYPSREKPKNYVPAINLEQLVIEAKANLTHGAIDLLTSFGIPTLFLRGGRPIGILHAHVAHGTVAIRRAQILAYNSNLGLEFVLASLTGAVENKRNLLRRLIKNRTLSTAAEEYVQQQITRLDNLLTEQQPVIEGKSLSYLREKLFAYEGVAAERYFSALRTLIPASFNFSSRNRRPPKDPINSLLSYGYSVLTVKVLSGVLMAGLEPYAGFLHTDRSGKPSFVLDLMEEFRQPVIDRIILKLVGRGEITPTDFETRGQFCKIKDDCKKHFLSEIYGTFTTKVTNSATDKELTFEQHIIHQARKAGKFFKGECDSYQPFIIER